MKKIRLDQHLVNQGLAETRSRAQRAIDEGLIKVNGSIAVKASQLVQPDCSLALLAQPEFVSRAGAKLKAALETFKVSPLARVCADVGASTGGFTDCLLQRGAARVYAIDVGYGQLAWKLRQDERVVVMDRTNVRYVEKLPEEIDLATIDTSFISLKLVLPAARRWLRPGGHIVSLIKPQFEAGREKVGKGGVVRDPRVHRSVLQEVLRDAEIQGWAVCGLICSPLLGPKGNREFLAWLKPGPAEQSASVDGMIESALGCVDRS